MLTESDLADLQRARALLENPGLAIKIANFAGKPVELGLARLPAGARDLVASATRKAIEGALDVALRTLGTQAGDGPRDWSHRLAVMATGGAGGAFGLAALTVELPVTTVLMLRSIAAHARAQGEDLSQAEARLNCVMVLALGGTSAGDDAAGPGYFAVRAGLGRAVAQVAEALAGRTAAELVADKSAPAMARLVASLATRFAPAVADKVAAQLVPILGAAGGVAINTVFINHFQDMAWAHFTIRRLEREAGADAVRAHYQLPQETAR